MKTVIIAWLATLWLIATGSLAAQAAPRPPVIIISIDGFRADYLDRGLTPTLSALAQGGLSTHVMRPSFPSVTFPNHYAIITGLRPDRNGIVDNIMVDAARPGETFTMATKDRFWWDQAEPVWVSAERAGLPTATLFWPGSETDIRGIRPTRWLPFDHAMTSRARVDQLFAWLDDPKYPRPAFMTLYFDEVDTAGHLFGPDTSPGLATALSNVDAAVARLRDGLAARRLTNVNLVIVADHGMAPIAPERIVWLDDLVDLSKVDVITQYTSSGLAPKAGVDGRALGPLVGKHDHAECWTKAQIPTRLHYGHNPRVPPIVCLAEPGWLLMTRAQATKRPPTSGGAHGYDPSDPSMAALFIANGPAFLPGKSLRPFDNVDVYPLLMHLLGLPASPSDGTLTPFKAGLRSLHGN